jgi:hypothetical protein
MTFEDENEHYRAEGQPKRRANQQLLPLSQIHYEPAKVESHCPSLIGLHDGRPRTQKIGYASKMNGRANDECRTA